VVETVEMIIQAQEAERQRLSRQMHDGPAQALSNFILQTEIAMRLFTIDQGKAKEELSNLKLSATSAFQKVRDFIFVRDDARRSWAYAQKYRCLQDQPV
jgi:two-component system sensor histidine kinase DegS